MLAFQKQTLISIAAEAAKNAALAVAASETAASAPSYCNKEEDVDSD